eukprot:1396142-Prymnesium_polylepis.1
MALRRLFFSWFWQLASELELRCLHPSVRGSMSARPRANLADHAPRHQPPHCRELSFSGSDLGRGPALTALSSVWLWRFHSMCGLYRQAKGWAGRGAPRPAPSRRVAPTPLPTVWGKHTFPENLLEI